MATYRSHAGTTYGSRTNTTVNKPAGTVEGDEMRMYFLLAASTQAGIPTPTFPSGWSVIAGPTTVNQDNNTGQFSVRSWTLRKRAGASEGASYTVTHSSASSDCVITTVQDALDADGATSANDGDGTGNITFLGVTTSAADSCILAFCHNWELWGTGTAPGGTTPTFTERQDSSSSLIHFSSGTWSGSGATGNKTKDSDNTSASGQWAAHLVAVENAAGGGGGQTVTINQATETDLAQAFGSLKTHGIAQASESDLAQAFTVGTAKAIGQASETDTAQAVASAKQMAIGQASEIDEAQVFTSAKVRAIGQASENDEAQAFGTGKQLAIGQATETDEAQPVTVEGATVVAIGQASEVDVAQSMEAHKALAIGQASEADSAQALIVIRRRTIGQAGETDSAQAFTWAPKIRVIGQAEEVDAALAMTRLEEEAEAAAEFALSGKLAEDFTLDAEAITFERPASPSDSALDF